MKNNLMKEFNFEDFTLILSRNCNLSCNYCPLDHFEAKMNNNVIKFFFDKLLKYKGYKFYITLFGGEPLLNKKAIVYIYNYLVLNCQIIKNNSLLFEIKIITNGTLIDVEYIEIFKKFNNISYLDFIIDISIDGTKDTQLTQRSYKIGFIDYYDKLIKNIKILKKEKVSIDLFLVMDLHNKKIIHDILFLINYFNNPIFLMPVDLTYDYILKNGDKIMFYVKSYLESIAEIILFIKKYKLENKIANFRVKTFIDIKLPPIGPTIDYNGDIYVTRDFLFQMDKFSKFDTIGNIFSINFSDMLEYFSNNFKKIENDSLHIYYGRSYNINKKIGDFFTNLIFKNNINEKHRNI